MMFVALGRLSPIEMTLLAYRVCRGIKYTVNKYQIGIFPVLANNLINALLFDRNNFFFFCFIDERWYVFTFLMIQNFLNIIVFFFTFSYSLFQYFLLSFSHNIQFSWRSCAWLKMHLNMNMYALIDEHTINRPLVIGKLLAPASKRPLVNSERWAHASK